MSRVPRDRGEARTASRLGHWLSWLADGTSSTVLFVLMAMTCIDVIGRSLFNAPLDGATELTQLMLGVIVFAVVPTVCLREDHITVDLLDPWFPAPLVRPRRIALNLLMAVMLAAVCWRVWILSDLTADYGDATEYLAIPLAPISYFIAALSGAGALALLANALHYLLRGEPVRYDQAPDDQDRDVGTGHSSPGI